MMNRRRILLLLIAIAMVVAGRFTTTWRPDPIVLNVQTSEAFRLIATVNRDGTSQVRRSGSGIDSTLLAESATPIVELLVDDERKRLFVLSESRLQCVNYIGGNELWSTYHRADPESVQLLCSPSLDWIALIGSRAFQYSSNRGIDIRVFEAATGKVVHKLLRNSLQQITMSDQNLTVKLSNGQVSPWALGTDGNSFQTKAGPSGEQRWTESTCAEYAPDGTLIRQWNTSRRNDPTQRSPERSVFQSPVVIVALSIAMIVPMVFWCRELITDGLVGRIDVRPFFNLLMVASLLFLIGAPLMNASANADPNPLQQRLWMFLLLGVAQATLFALLIRIEQPRHLWIAILAACTFPPMLLVVALARAIRSTRYARSPSRKKFRFGIAELLLSTTGIAFFIGIGIQSRWLLGAGFGIALHILISYLFTRTREWAWATLVVSVVLVTLALTLQSFTNLSALFYLLVVPLCFSVIGIHGWVLEERVDEEQQDPGGSESPVDFWSPA
ncbi:MAG: hypothetical protein AAFX06_15860 [Planctomycetota bacterium]